MSGPRLTGHQTQCWLTMSLEPGLSLTPGLIKEEKNTISMGQVLIPTQT